MVLFYELYDLINFLQRKNAFINTNRYHEFVIHNIKYWLNQILVDILPIFRGKKFNISPGRYFFLILITWGIGQKISLKILRFKSWGNFIFGEKRTLHPILNLKLFYLLINKIAKIPNFKLNVSSHSYNTKMTCMCVCVRFAKMSVKFYWIWLQGFEHTQIPHNNLNIVLFSEMYYFTQTASIIIPYMLWIFLWMNVHIAV